MDNKVVIFTPNNARILCNPKNIEQYKSMPNAIINPILTEVEGVPPHLWKLEKGKIVPLTEGEIKGRQAHIEKYGAINDLDSGPAVTKTSKLKLGQIALLVLNLSAITFVILRILNVI